MKRRKRILTPFGRLVVAGGIMALVALAYAVVLLGAEPVDTLQFGLVEIGSSQADVQRRLGWPDVIIDEGTEVRTRFKCRSPECVSSQGQRGMVDGVSRSVHTETWVYQGDNHTLTSVFTFLNGVLARKDKR